MIDKKHISAIVIGNGGLGDTITYVGMVNYLATIYEQVLVACQKQYAEQISIMFNRRNVLIYPFIVDYPNMHVLFREMTRLDIFDIFAFGNYGAKSTDQGGTYTKIMQDGTTRKIIAMYPTSYYEDVGIPFKYAWEYFTVNYPPNIIALYDKLFALNIPYIVTHTISSNSCIDLFELRHLDKERNLVIDINKNYYETGHKFHDIAQKFINLPCITYYQKLLIYASKLYLMDSCLFALALITDVSRAEVRECFKRESRFAFYTPDWIYTFVSFTPEQIYRSTKLDMTKRHKVK